VSDVDASGSMCRHSGSSIPLIRVLTGRWTIALLVQLGGSDRRHEELHDKLDGTSHKVPTLPRVERDGVVIRRIDSDRVESTTLYQLTDLGRSRDEPFSALRQWVDSHWSETEASHRISEIRTGLRSLRSSGFETLQVRSRYCGPVPRSRSGADASGEPE
jgi:DNA-binding HxlR family transcriptional regulator